MLELGRGWHISMLTRRDVLAGGAAGAASITLATVTRKATAASALQLAQVEPALPVKKLILVHGRDQQGQNPEQLKQQWLAALAQGAAKTGRTLPATVEVVFPFYGDVLDGFARKFDLPLTEDIQLRGAPANDDFLLFQANVADDLRQRAGISDAEVEQAYGADPNERGPLNWRWVQAILRTLDQHAGGLSGSTLELFLRDVYLYTNRAGVRDAVDRIVGASFTEEPAVVIGHSLGSVVAYSVLTTDRRALKVPLLVTVGSPLGIRAVRDSFRPIRYPKPPLGSWYNAFDPRDVVALYALDQASFPVKPPIENNATVINGTPNRHGIAGYLDDSTVAGRVLDGLGGQPH